MNRLKIFFGLSAALALAGCGGGPPPSTDGGGAASALEKAAETTVALLDGATSATAADAGGSSFEAEKQKALASPYANDLGPAELDPKVLATYPKEHQDAYKNVLLVKCAKCHAPSRPLNSQFFEPAGKKDEKQAKLDALKKSEPDVFKNKNIWQPETDIWQRYVKRMMSKPGCEISSEQGKAVWGFLVYDSNQRKAGKNREAWKAHRTKLLTEFKAKYPERYKDLYEKESAAH